MPRDNNDNSKGFAAMSPSDKRLLFKEWEDSFGDINESFRKYITQPDSNVNKEKTNEK